MHKRLFSLTLFLLSLFYSNYVSAALDCNTAININTPTNECQALVDLYKYTSGPTWTYNMNWDTDTDVATRYGITTSGGHVIGLSLTYNELSGTLPDSLNQLTELESFYLDSNRLTGVLSPLWSSRRNIKEFNISTNYFPGRLPDARKTWTKITFFNAGHNQLHGTLPDSRSAWRNIEYFYVYTNQIRGTFPITRDTWTKIRLFYADDNQLEGALPDSRNSRRTIEEFSIGSNQIGGKIPNTRSGWSDIYYFNISDNNIAGSLEPVRNWSTLFYFYAASNQLHGTLPDSRDSWFPTRYTFSDFDLSDNFLTGSIPSSRYLTWPDKGFSYLRLFGNCLQTGGYTAGMQSWLNTNATYIPQKNCSINPPTILLPTNSQVLNTGNITMSGTGGIGNTISVTLNGVTLTGIVNTSGLRYLSFNNMSNGVHTASAFQTDAISTYNSSTVTRNFSINTLPPLTIKPVKTKSPIN